MRIVGGYELGAIMHEEGLLPPECLNVEILTPADGALQIRYTVNVHVDDLPKLARVFARLHQETSE